MKIALAGIGNVATRNYLPVLREHPGAEFAYWNRTRAAAESAAQTFGGEIMASPTALAAWQPDVAFVLTSETCHHRVGRELISGGVSKVFFEKPLVALHGQAHVDEADYTEARSLLALADEHGCQAAMMFNYRFFDQTIRARELVRTRNLGQVINATGLVHYACWSHCIDLIRHFAGDFLEVTCLAGPSEHAGQGMVAHDLAAAFTLTSGGAGTLVGTAGMEWQHPLFELTFTFERGRIHLRDLDGELEVLDGSGRVHERFLPVRDSSRWDHYNASFRKALGAYLASIANDTTPPVPARDGLAELSFEAALRRSIRERRPVKVAKEFPC